MILDNFDNGTESVENKEVKVKQVKENKGCEVAGANLQTQKQTQFPSGTAERPSKMWEKETGATGVAVSQRWCANTDRFGDEDVEAVVRVGQVLSLLL